MNATYRLSFIMKKKVLIIGPNRKAYREQFSVNALIYAGIRVAETGSILFSVQNYHRLRDAEKCF